MPVPAEEYEKGFFQITLFSYVGTFLNAQSLRQVGLVDPNYFIYADDSEHSLRMRHACDIVCVPAIQIIHDSYSDYNDNGAVTVSWKTYYFTRNLVHMVKKHCPLSLFRTISDRYLSTCHGHPEQKQIFWDAVKDALHGNLGLHPLYRPGYKIRKQPS